MTPEDVKCEIQSLIDQKPVIMFSKTYCPYCTRAKNIFKDLGVTDMEVVELDKLSDRQC